MIAKNVSFSDDKQELLKSILPGFPISVFLTSFGPDTYNCVNWHWHTAFQYCLVLSGNVTFMLPNRSCTAAAGNGIFINTEQAHFIKAADDSTSSYLCVDIPPSFICFDERSRIHLKYMAPVLNSTSLQMVLLSRQTSPDCEILKSLQTIQSLFMENGDFLELDVYAEVIRIWKLTCQKLQRYHVLPSAVVADDNSRLKNILHYLQEHYAEKITLDDVAEQVMLSRSECSRFFRKTTDQSLFTYLNLLRINKSMDLLRSSEMSIAEIADAVGFCSQSYYTDCFRKSKKITPKQFRLLSERKAQDVLPCDLSLK